MVIAKNYGRMGNVLYQNACSIQYALKHGLQFSIPNTTNDPKWNPLYLQHLANPGFNPNLPAVTIKEKCHEFQDIPFLEEYFTDENVVLDGYWQSYKYFDWCRDKILELFNFPWEMKRGIVSIHVRRGDFLKYPQKHFVLTDEYLYSSILKMEEKVCVNGKSLPDYLFHSDDIEWCKDFVEKSRRWSNFFENRMVWFSECKTEVEDMISMSCCEHNIISNSTFGVWGAELNRNPNKVVIVPSKKYWFGPSESHLKIDDIYRPEWIQIDL
jgi:hypothetical protein